MPKKTFISLLLLVCVINICLLFIYDQIKSLKKNQIQENNQPPYGMQNTTNPLDLAIDNYHRSTVITEAVQKIEPAVVSIYVIKTEITHNLPFYDDFYYYFFGPPERNVESMATGVLFTVDGYIITNSHVVERAKQINVVSYEGTEYAAKLIGLDIMHDIAIIKIEADNLIHAQLGNSSDLLIGEWAIAIGNPYGFLMKDSKPSVSVGVISAVDRNFSNQVESKIYKGMIQTDAAINPGNSGGPLVNIHGEVIGINSFIFSESGGSIGIGFAIPIDRVKRISSELISFGMIREVYLGFKIQDITRLIANYLKLKNTNGVIVSIVDPKGPAQIAGLKRGDLIYYINNDFIKNSTDAALAVSDLTPHEQITIKLIREGKEIEITLTAGEYQ